VVAFCTQGTLTGWVLRTPGREGLPTHQRSGCTDLGVASFHMLKDEDLEHFRKRLAAERVVVESRIAARSREVQATVRDEEGVGDRADEATLLYDREQAIDDADLDRETLAQIDRALERIEAGTYGVSEVSGKPIPIDRLEAVPYAITLVDEEALQPER
jgi:DnaK suppressor protein